MGDLFSYFWTTDRPLLADTCPISRLIVWSNDYKSIDLRRFRGIGRC